MDKRLLLILIPMLLLLIFVFLALFVIKTELQPQQNITLPPVPPAELPEGSAPESDEYTKEVFENYTNELMATLLVAGDPFNLDNSSEKRVRNLLSAIQGGGPVAIINGEAYSDFDVVPDAGAYFLKPAGLDGNTSSYPRLMSQNITAAQILNSIPDELQRTAIGILYNSTKDLPLANFTEGNFSSLAVAELTSYLDSQASLGVIGRYEYSPIDGFMVLYYPNENLPFALETYDYITDMRIASLANEDPETYSSILREGIKVRLSAGNILVGASYDGKSKFGFVDKGTLSSMLRLLLDDSLDKNKKLSEISEGTQFLRSYPLSDPLLQSPTGAATAVEGGASSIQDFMETRDPIVPPNKEIWVMLGPEHRTYLDYLVNPIQAPHTQFYSDLRPSMDSFVKNGYTFKVSPRTNIGGAMVEELADLMSDQNKNIIVTEIHGAVNKILVEAYDLGDYAASLLGQAPAEKEFELRVELLKKEYGNSSIIGYTTRALSRKQGRVCLTPDFFKNPNFKKKAIYIFISCHGGSFAFRIKSRVLISSLPENAIIEPIFLSDLKKVDAYLLKQSTPGALAITAENMRNYNIMASFRQKQYEPMPHFESWGAPGMIYDAFNLAIHGEPCTAEKDTLCSAKLYSAYLPYSSNRETVSVSPHVQQASGTRILFNVPMDIQISPASTVTLDESQCSLPFGDISSLKPVWSSDKELTLPWDTTYYRSQWQDSDFDSNGKPKVKYAKITVASQNAVSKFSQIPLTGNPDCCNSSGCASRECWLEPYTIARNGNQPKTDFVFFLPCATNRTLYYEACEEGVEPRIVNISLTETMAQAEIAQSGSLDNIRVGEDCYSLITPSEDQKNSAKSVTDWTFDSVCASECKSLYYAACDIGGDTPMIKLPGQAEEPPDFIRNAGRCYRYVCSSTDPSCESEETGAAKLIEDGWAPDSNCANTCTICRLKFPVKFHWTDEYGEGWVKDDKDRSYAKYVNDLVKRTELAVMDHASGKTTVYIYQDRCDYPCRYCEDSSTGQITSGDDCKGPTPECATYAKWSCDSTFDFVGSAPPDWGFGDPCAAYPSTYSDLAGRASFVCPEGVEGPQCAKAALDIDTGFWAGATNSFIPGQPLFGPNGECSEPPGTGKNPQHRDQMPTYAPSEYAEMWGRQIHFQDTYNSSMGCLSPDHTGLTFNKRSILRFDCYEPLYEGMPLGGCVNTQYCIWLDDYSEPFTLISSNFPDSVFEIPDECEGL